MDREYLEDYEQRENARYERFIKNIQENKFSFEEDRFPPDERFVNIQKPVAFASFQSAKMRNLWAQVPFSGSLILVLLPAPKLEFEHIYFRVSEIPKVIDFIKETGKLQIARALLGLAYQKRVDHTSLQSRCSPYIPQ